MYSSCRKNCFHIQPRLDRRRVSVSSCFPTSISLFFLRAGPLEREIASALRRAHAHRRTTIQVLIFPALRVPYKWRWSYLPKLQSSAAHPHSSSCSHARYLKENWETITYWLKIPCVIPLRLEIFSLLIKETWASVSSANHSLIKRISETHSMK